MTAARRNRGLHSEEVTMFFRSPTPGFTFACAFALVACSSTALDKPVADPVDGGSIADDPDTGVDPGQCGTPPPSEGDYVPGFTEDDLGSTDYTIKYAKDPDALVTSAVHMVKDDMLRVTLTGIVDVDQDHPSTPIDFRDVPVRDLGPDSFAVTFDGKVATPSRVSCSGNPETPISIVFVVDVTGSMGGVIAAVRDSLLDFVDESVKLGLHGKVGVVTYQDTVGVNIPFDQCEDGVSYERSPFFAPVALDDKAGVKNLQSFIGRLRADGGQDIPENLAAALDFAANNVIGYTADGQPNVIGKGKDDPEGTAPWPADELDGLVMFISITDASFHGDSSRSSSVPGAFKPRKDLEILESMGGRIISSIDPAFIDAGTDLGKFSERDADLWPRFTGGFGGDSHKIKIDLGGGVSINESVSYFDLELLVLARGLLEIPLAPVLASTCVIEVPAQETPSKVNVAMTSSAGNSTFTLTPRRVSTP